MQMRQIEELEEYLDVLRTDAGEVRALADDLLITVTSFFRDPAMWQQLTTGVVPVLFEARDPSDPVRVWSVGCATGEEAYSLAMLLLEESGRRDAPPQIQVFASDLHEPSLARAREGSYPGDITVDVEEARLRRFFQPEDGGFRIRKEVRELVIFAPHNLLVDPPFSRLDLIICRNLLIYLQRDVIDIFHYALNPDGVLVLGSSESLEDTELFRTEDKRHCVFRKRNVRGPDPRLPGFPRTWPRQFDEPRQAVQGAEPLAFGALQCSSCCARSCASSCAPSSTPPGRRKRRSARGPSPCGWKVTPCASHSTYALPPGRSTKASCC
jgi:two-component system, chemotaxis family, CheB/CheR fusion protein